MTRSIARHPAAIACAIVAALTVATACFGPTVIAGALLLLFLLVFGTFPAMLGWWTCQAVATTVSGAGKGRLDPSRTRIVTGCLASAGCLAAGAPWAGREMFSVMDLVTAAVLGLGFAVGVVGGSRDLRRQILERRDAELEAAAAQARGLL